MRTLLGTLLISVCLVLSSCASSIKSQAVTGLQVAHASVGSGQDAEIQLFAASAIPAYTVEQHKAFHAALVKYFDAEAKVITLLQAWRAGDPPPANLGEASAALTEALTVLKPMAPTSLSKVITYVQQGITALQHVLALTKGGA